MKTMKRVRDGKIAVFDQGCVDSGNWVAVEEKAEAAKPGRKKKQAEPLNEQTTEQTSDEESVNDQESVHQIDK